MKYPITGLECAKNSLTEEDYEALKGITERISAANKELLGFVKKFSEAEYQMFLSITEGLEDEIVILESFVGEPYAKSN